MFKKFISLFVYIWIIITMVTSVSVSANAMEIRENNACLSSGENLKSYTNTYDTESLTSRSSNYSIENIEGHSIGDIDDDGAITIIDMTEIMIHLVDRNSQRIDKSQQYEQYYNPIERADVNLDGKITKLDAILLYAYITEVKICGVEISAFESYDESEQLWQHPVSSFNYALGSFAWDKHADNSNSDAIGDLIERTNYDKLFLKVEITFGEAVIDYTCTPRGSGSYDVKWLKQRHLHTGILQEVNYQLIAPDGFSFSKTELESEYSYTFNYVEIGSTEVITIPINPIYSQNYNDGDDVNVIVKEFYPDEDEFLYEAPIGKIHKRAGEGEIAIADYEENLRVELTPEMFSQSPNTYSQELARLGIGLSSMEYATDEEIEESYKNLGFGQIQIFSNNASENKVNYSFATKRMIIEGKIVTLIAAPVRGTIEKSEWAGNMDAFVKDNGDHRSFRSAANDMRTNFINYLGITGYSLAGERKFFITGHSRGAAVANLLGSDIDNDQIRSYATSTSTYVYTYATPNTTNDAFISHDRFRNIINIINIIDYNDIVTMLPPRYMGFNKYGVTYSFALDSSRHTYLTQIVTNVNNLYLSYAREEYNPLSEADRMRITYYLARDVAGSLAVPIWDKAGTAIKAFIDLADFVKRAICTHSPANYIAWMETLHNEREMIFSEINYKKIEIQCPVDVIITDMSGKIVGRTVNGVMDDVVSNKDVVLLAVDGDRKLIVIPDIGSYTVRMNGYDNGKMNVTVVDYAEHGKIGATCFYNAPVNNNEYYTMAFANSHETYSLVTNTGAVALPDRVYGQEEIDQAKISVTVIGSGKIIGDGAYTSGETAVVSAVPVNADFLGWYEGDMKVSGDLNYTFVVTESRKLTARFTGVPKYLGDADGDGGVTVFDATAIQRQLVSLPNDSYVETAADTDEDGTVTVFDATMIQRYLVNLPSNENIGKVMG